MDTNLPELMYFYRRSQEIVFMKIAIIGCGEVGTLYAEAFHAVTKELHLCDPRPSPKALLFSQQNHAALSTSVDEWLREADLVLSCVVGTVSLKVASSAFPFMRRGAMYADMTTCDPAEIREAAVLAEQAGIEYVDVAIMGAVVLGGIKTPLLCAGSGAAKLSAIFKTIDAPIRTINNGVPGDAATLKILRSVFTKGLEALAIETFIAAEKRGLTDELYEALEDIDKNPLQSTLESFVRTHLIHAPRRLHEIEEAERLLRESDLPIAVLPGVRALFERTCRCLDRQPVAEIPRTARDAFEWLANEAKRDLPTRPSGKAASVSTERK
jgi:3-hydroxyisobutyrate dehydrogenase-like beta-hydroxyacid dehydrogenase